MSAKSAQPEGDAPSAEVWEHWEQLAASKENLSPFLMPAWYRALQTRIPEFQPCPRLFEIEGHRAVLPLVSSRWHLGFRLLESGPWATYGGLVADCEFEASRLAETLSAVPSLSCPSFRLTTPPGVEEVPGAHHIVHKCTRLVDLRPGYDEIHQHVFTRQMRSGIRRAQERDVEIVVGDSEEDDRAFLDMYEESRTRWGDETEGFPSAFLSGWSAQPDNFARLWLARLDGKAVAGALVLYGRGQAHYLAGAGDRDAFPARPNNLLFAAIITDACERGCTSLNLGSSAGLEGVERFKEQMGGKPAGYVATTFEHVLLRILRMK